jgi:hypothetical protein
MDGFDDTTDNSALEPDVNGEDADLWAEPLIEYWIWTGTRLIPASADQADRLREREAFQRLELWKQHLEREQRRSRRSQWSRQAFAWVRAQGQRVVAARTTVLQRRDVRDVWRDVAGARDAAHLDARDEARDPQHPQGSS